MNRNVREKDTKPSTFIIICCLFLINLNACTGNSPILSTPSPLSPDPTDTLFANLSVLNTPTPACVNGLTFISDLTLEDNTIVTPGTKLDKQWLVQNSGTCNWDSRYRLRLINDVALGALPELALYPARAGLQATVRIIFTAPSDAGSYTSEWQAFDLSGIPFGDSFYIKVVVQP
jgi:Ig-like domain from next to BRCA1 gene